jgi:hypothetical protein
LPALSKLRQDEKNSFSEITGRMLDSGYNFSYYRNTQVSDMALLV